MNQNQGGLAAALAGALICVGIVLLIVLGIYIFFCISMQRTMSAIRPKNRLIPPGLVWLHMLHLGGVIPFLGILLGLVAAVWDLIMVLKIAGSLRKEYKSRGWRIGNEQFGKSTGLIWTIGSLVATPVGFLIGFMDNVVGDPDLMGIIGLFLIGFSLIIFICFIIYWVQIHGFGTKLLESGGRRRTSEEEDYDDDHQPRRRRARPRDDDEDEDEDDAPRSRRRRDEDDEEDEAPRSRRRRDDDDDEEDRPRRRRRRDEDDDD